MPMSPAVIRWTMDNIELDWTRAVVQAAEEVAATMASHGVGEEGGPHLGPLGRRGRRPRPPGHGWTNASI